MYDEDEECRSMLHRNCIVQTGATSNQLTENATKYIKPRLDRIPSHIVVAGRKHLYPTRTELNHECMEGFEMLSLLGVT